MEDKDGMMNQKREIKILKLGGVDFGLLLIKK